MINHGANAAVSQPLAGHEADEKAVSSTIFHFPTWQDKMRRENNFDPSKSWADQESDDEQFPAASHDHAGDKVNKAAVSSKPLVEQLVVKVTSRTLRAASMRRARGCCLHTLPDACPMWPPATM